MSGFFLPLHLARVAFPLLALVFLASVFAASAPAAENWAIRSSTYEGRAVPSLASGGGLALIVTYQPGEGSRLLLSADGRDYDEVYALDSHWLSSATYGGGQFVVVGDHGRVLTSADGKMWTEHDTGTGHWLEWH